MNAPLRFLAGTVIAAGLAIFARGAQEPEDILVPDELSKIVIEPIVFEKGAPKEIKVTAYFIETLVDSKGSRPTIKRVKGSVQIDLLKDAAQTVTVKIVNPVTNLVEETIYSCGELIPLLRAIAEKNWAQVMPPPLPQTRRSLRNAPPVAMVKP